ncbi:MAG: 2Fe-2S iron-sulfur cluster-binding protein [Acidimicrobiales bacterium]
MLAVQADGASLTTIEGLATGDQLHPIQQALHESHGFQCAFCAPGFLMTTLCLLEDNPTPTRDEIRRDFGNLCRCTGYHSIIEGIETAVTLIAEGTKTEAPMRESIAGTFVGHSVKRVEDRRLLTGQGQFIADVEPDGVAHAAFLRSPFAHAEIISIDTSAALVARGVRCPHRRRHRGSDQPVCATRPYGANTYPSSTPFPRTRYGSSATQ